MIASQRESGQGYESCSIHDRTPLRSMAAKGGQEMYIRRLFGNLHQTAIGIGSVWAISQSWPNLQTGRLKAIGIG